MIKPFLPTSAFPDKFNFTQIMHITQRRVIGEEILKHIFRYRRLLSDTELCTKEPCTMCFAPHLAKLEFFIKQEKPIHFILPAFPAKSPNPLKVLGARPDMGEKVALQFLQSLCDHIRNIYPPGAKLTICSDGRVFGSLVGITDEKVTLYRRGIQKLLNEIKANDIDIFNLDNVFGEIGFDEMRKILQKNYAKPIENFRQSVKTNENSRQLLNGIHRFLFEDYLVLHPHKARSKVRSECKTRAYQVIQQSNAWSSLIAQKFPQSLRLSIHPQPVHSEKIGIYLVKTLERWGTPWHNSAVFNGTEFMLMKRSDLETMGAKLIYQNDRPSHFVLS